MIARMWKGVVRRADADAYADYIRDTGFREYAETPGNRGALMLRRDDGDRVTHYDVVDSLDTTPRMFGAE